MTFNIQPTIDAANAAAKAHGDDMAASAANFSAIIAGRDQIIAARDATIVKLQAQINSLNPIRFGIDLSDLTTDKPLTEAQKVASHRAAGLALTDVRVFAGSAVPSWSMERIKALDPTLGDSVVISTLSRDVAGMTTFFKNTPDEWRGHVDLSNGHEREADLLASANPQAVNDWLAGCLEKATMLDGLGAWGYSSDNFGKIMLHFTQEHGPTAQRDTRARFYGGQDFGWFGEDCYHYSTWLNQQDRYETPAELFDGILDFCAQIKRPCRIPEWGAVLAKTDTLGVRRGKAITDGGAYLKAKAATGLVIQGANWWCGSGSPDTTQPGGVRNFHLEHFGAASPELAAYLAL